MRNSLTSDLTYLMELGKMIDPIEGHSNRTIAAYNKVKGDILKEAQRTRTISKADLVFLKTFIKEYPDLLEDFEKTFGKYFTKDL